jgi:hypothetical protein
MENSEASHHHSMLRPVRVTVRTVEGRVQVHCHPEILDVPRGKEYVVLDFHLESRHEYQFPATNAVVISGVPEFPLVSWTSADRTAVKLFDFNSDNGKYSYDVAVVRKNKPEQFVGAAFIQNGAK